MPPIHPSAVIPDRLIGTLLAPLAAFETAALAVSGGPDSMALMCIVRRSCAVTARDPASISILTVDHGLRTNSANEAAFVAQAAKKLGFAHAVLPWDGAKPATALQATARAARYRLMIGFCRQNGIACLVTAHTGDDQAETFMMRLKRGSGIDGLAAIAPSSDRDGIALLRPLLTISKARLTAHLRAVAVPFVTDPSNENEAFERVRVRYALRIAQKAGVTPVELGRSAMRLNRARDALAFAARETMQAALLVFPLGDGEIDRNILSRAPDEIALRVFAGAIAAVGGGAGPLELAKLERLLPDIACSGFKATLGGCKLHGSAHKITIVREVGRISRAGFMLTRGTDRIWDGRFHVSLAGDAAGPVQIGPLGHAGLTAARKCRVTWPIPLSRQWRTAALSTPAVWQGSKLSGLPMVQWADAAASGGVIVEARLDERLARFLKHSGAASATELGK